jgi:hypothetical protein
MTYIVYTKQQFRAAVADATEKATIKLCGSIDLANGENILVPGNVHMTVKGCPIDISEPLFARPEHERVVFFD